MKKIKLGRSGKFATVDDKDYPKTLGYNWWLSKEGAAYTQIGDRENRRNLYLHRLIMTPSKDKVVDHINHDRLDNRRENLRICLQADNRKNSIKRRDSTNKYKGVCLIQGRHWMARIRHQGEGIYLGYFKSQELAALAYNEAAIKLFGEYASLNILEGTK